jgi:hypothetical protein
VAYRTWGTRAYAYEPDYAYAYAPDYYAYGYDGDYYAPGVSVGLGFSSEPSYAYQYRSGRHYRNGSRMVVRDRQRTVARDSGFVRTNVRGDTNFGADTTIRSRSHRSQLSGNAQARAQLRTEGRGNAQFRSEGQAGGRAQMGGRAPNGGGRSDNRGDMR